MTTLQPQFLIANNIHSLHPGNSLNPRVIHEEGKCPSQTRHKINIEAQLFMALFCLACFCVVVVFSYLLHCRVFCLNTTCNVWLWVA